MYGFIPRFILMPGHNDWI